MHFFLQFLPESQKEDFRNCILTEMFRMIYSVNLKGEFNIVRTLMYAFDDAIHGVRGKAAEGKILPRPAVPNRVEQALRNKESVEILFNGSFEGIGNIVRNIRTFAPDIRIVIAVDERTQNQTEALRKQYPDCEIRNHQEMGEPKCDIQLIMCSHIFSLTPDMPRANYIDAWCNIIFSRKDFIYASSYEQTKDLFILCKKSIMEEMAW